jgi:DNA-binding CsgD family transcriptional regulator/PAS domain-containing protein
MSAKNAHKQVDDIPGTSTGQSGNLTDLLLASFLLHQGKLSDETWLEIFAKTVDCDAAACIRWTNGRPDYPVVSAYGELPELPPGWRTWADRVINGSGRREPGYIEDFALAALDPKLRAENNFTDPRIILGVVDWEPACIIMLMARDNDKAPWGEFERKKIAQILGCVRESINVHKILDRRRYISGLARDILNSSPRGMIALSDDGVIQLANTRAEAILAMRDGISRHQGKLLINDPKAAGILAAHLAGLANMKGDGLPEMDWNLVARRPSGAGSYQMILGSIRLHEWNIESRRSDRVAIVYLHDRANTERPTPTQLRDFYGMTAAQARLAGLVYSGKTIADAAEELHVSVNTARTHMRGIYAKTGVSSQTELISLLASGLKTYGTRKD